jgi:hypothetical protein
MEQIICDYKKIGKEGKERECGEKKEKRKSLKNLCSSILCEIDGHFSKNF